MKARTKRRSFQLLSALTLAVLIAFLTQSVYAAYTSDSLVLSLNLSENGGTTAADSSGTGNAATVQGTPTWSGGNITFDGSDDRLLVGDTASLDGPSHTYEVWFTMPDSSGWSSIPNPFPRLIDKIPNDNSSGTNILINKTNRQVQVFFAGSSWSNVTSGANSGNVLIATNALDYSSTYHIVFTYDNSSKLGQIYINDSLAASGTTSGNYLANNMDLAIGGRPEDDLRNIVGTVHRVSVYNKALSSAEVAANYAEGADYEHSDVQDPNAVSAAQSSLSASPTSVRANGTAL